MPPPTIVMVKLIRMAGKRRGTDFNCDLAGVKGVAIGALKDSPGGFHLIVFGAVWAMAAFQQGPEGRTERSICFNSEPLHIIADFRRPRLRRAFGGGWRVRVGNSSIARYATTARLVRWIYCDLGNGEQG